MSSVMVLAMVSVALALSYSMLRSQATRTQIHQNMDLRAAARHAALTGLSVGLGRMHRSQWAGAESTLSGQVSGNASYTVQYVTGDASLSPGGAGDSDWPYRVTLEVTGTAFNPAHPDRSTTSLAQAVVQFVPRQLSPEPAPWPAMQAYIVYQTGIAKTMLQIPCRIEGLVRLQGKLDLCTSHPSPDAARRRYLSDLKLMSQNGYPDYRPLTGPVMMPTASSDAATASLLTTVLGVSVQNIAVSATPGWVFPGSLASYQLFPGGATYAVPSLPSVLGNVTYQPDPRTNPAGLFYCSGDLQLGNNVSITGSLVVSGALTLNGTNIVVQSFALPTIEGSSLGVHLPAAVVQQQVRILDGVKAVVRGTVASWQEFVVLAGSQNTSFDLRGRVIAPEMHVQSRTEWNLGVVRNTWWTSFQGQQGLPDGQHYFPVWLQGLGLPPTPLLTFKPEAGPLAAHWRFHTDPVYVADPSDAGLRWQLVSVDLSP